MADFDWLDVERFPGRRHLASLARNHRPERGSARPVDALDFSLRQRWADHLGVAADDLLLCASASDAWRLLCAAALLPGDVALLAQPCATALPAAVLATGAIDPGAMERARQMHPRSIALAESPNLFGGDDAVILSREPGPRALFVDARHAASLAGEGAVVAAADATVICLRDPDEPASAALHGIVCRRDGAMLRATQGSDPLPIELLEHGLAHLARGSAGADAGRRWQQVLAARRVRLLEAVGEHPGAVVFDAAGTRAAIGCRAGDGADLVGHLMPLGLSVQAGNAHPMRNLVICDLAASAP